MTWDKLFFEELLPFLLKLSLGLFLFWAGHRWGGFAARQVLHSRRAKWRAYFLALLPPATMWLILVLEPHLRSSASAAFWAMASSAVVAACIHYNQDGFLGKMLLRND